MSTQLRISGKNLGELSLQHYCPRCVWLKLKLNGQLPYQSFPGIFSSIDAYTKHVVHGWFDDHNAAPPWLGSLGTITGYINPPHHSKFFYVDETYNVKITGAADGILQRGDGSLLIVDYKTAKFSDNQDTLLPIYETQLNAYAIIAEKTGLGSVSGLALIYMEPQTTDVHAKEPRHKLDSGFGMSFSATIKPITRNADSIAPLLARARELFDLQSPPPMRDGCKECPKMGRVIESLAMQG